MTKQFEFNRQDMLAKGATARRDLCFGVLIAIVLSLSASPSLSAQATQLGFSNSTPSFGHGHDYIQLLNETVNPADGSLTLRIDVPTPAGRGLNFPYALTYNSSAIRGLYEPTTSNPGGPIYVQWSYPANTNSTYQGWSDTVPRLVAQHTPYFEGYVAPYGDQGWYEVICEAWQGFQFTDPSGQVHQPHNFLVGGGTGGQGFTCPGGGAIGTDGTLQAAASTNGGAQFATVDGTVYNFTLASSWSGGVLTILPALIEDRNGNKLTIGSGSQIGNEVGSSPFQYSSVTDTLGRMVISHQPVDATHHKLYVSGIPNPYSITLTSASPSSGVAVPQESYDYGSRSTAPTLPALPALQGGVASIGLPDGGSYTFSYDPVFGNLSKITYPNGGYVSYTWGFPASFTDDANYQSQYIICDDPSCATVSPASDQIYVKFKMPVILTRSVSFDGSTTALTQTFNYQTTFTAGDMVDGWRSKTTTVTTNDLIAGTTSSVTYSYLPIGPSENLTQRYTGQTAQENQIVYKDGNGNTLQTVCKAWVGGDLLLSQTTILPNGMVSEHAYSYGGIEVSNDFVNVPNGDDYYDFSAPQATATCANAFVGPVSEPTPGLLLSSTRQTLTTATTSLYSYGPSILNTPSSTITTDGSGNTVAETDYQYTNAIAAKVSGVVQHDTAFDSGSQVRQNLLSAKKQCFPSCASVTTTYSYDNTGQVLSATDGLTNTTYYSYTDAYATGAGQTIPLTNAYVTKVTAPSTNGIQHIQQATYGYYDGKIRTTTDENNNVTTYCYAIAGCSGTTSDDPWMRLTQVQYPDGGTTSAVYTDTGTSPSVVSSTALNSSSTLVQTSIGDGMGHVVRRQTNSDPAGTVTVDTVYAGTGAIFSMSNPYRNLGLGSQTDSTYGVSTSTYDALGRKILQYNPDGSFRQWCYNGISSNSAQTVCSTNNSSVTNATWVDTADELGRHWQQVSDGLGRLVAVLEPDPTTNVPSLETDYGYSALDDLISVIQTGGSVGTTRRRSFTYDSFSRLVTSSNPENGSISYKYSLSGSLCAADVSLPCSKTDARGVTVTYTYDALNRLLSKAYPAGTATSCYQYDQSSVPGASGNLIGHLTNKWTQVSTTCAAALPGTGVLSRRSMLAYDQMGRLRSEQQCTAASCGGTVYSPAYTYDLAGEMTTRTSGINNGAGSLVFTNAYNAAGQLSAVTSNSTSFPNVFASAESSRSTGGCNTGPFGFSVSPSYNAAGGLQNATLGSGILLTRSYDNRFRTTCEKDVIVSAPGIIEIPIRGGYQPQ